MNAQQTELYQRIQTFSFDRPDTQLTFSKKLAKDNGWSLRYAQKVISEYKKFAFLAVVAGHPVAPSDQVDQVWHLHLSYTRSYWQEFCLKVLQFPLHHEPSRGGLSEQLKLDDWYNRTLESYEKFFGETPPIDIWPKSKDRFGRDLKFVRVNTQQNWIFPKPSLPTKIPHQQILSLILLFTLASAIAGCQIVSSVPNPLDLTGGEFLTFYFLLSIITFFLAFHLRNSLRLPDENFGQRTVPLNTYETAYLAGGKDRVVDTAIASLVQKEYVIIQPDKRTLTLNKSGEDLFNAVEKELAKVIALNGHINSIRKAFISHPIIETIGDRLREIGLLVTQNQSAKVQTYPTILIASLLGLGIAKIVVGISREKPVGYLIIMCFIIAIIGLGFWLSPAHRSRYGDRIFQDLRTHIRLTVFSHTDPQLPLAFALLGATILPSEMFSDLKQLFIPTSSSGGGDGGGGCGGDGGGDGGGGCGGGGCGGCGGGCGG
ncbi:TIGR04222 domain-containing membrane protein [Aerosakkonemataceae cyanobacterium BLCC-F154]|uniref:TIGR04222 domain-containing membrane protein n=1 Tax=Floridaenema fluviatile BLCC-F154 TaxID=3153640 RepID=A0ABV4YGC2_9CYAN